LVKSLTLWLEYKETSLGWFFYICFLSRIVQQINLSGFSMSQSQSQWLQEKTLIGQLVVLRPLSIEDKQGLLEAASDGNLWELWFTQVPSKDTIDDYLNQALEQQVKNQSLVFVITCKNSKKILGLTRFCNLDSQSKRLEIGYTWYRESVQRTGVNSETKLLLLAFAFEELNVIAVEFRTHWMNQKSRNAILRLGAKQDGVLRNHRKMSDGSYRDTVVFSIIESEWLAVKKHLSFKLTQN
jgi:N-acetyltransferase